MFTSWTDLIYLGICVTIASWVGRALHQNGRVFLVEVFTAKEDLADSVNHLLVVGFYLLAIGFVTMAVQIGNARDKMTQAVEFVSTEVGLVLLVLGGMHFMNLFTCSRLRWRIRLAGTQPCQFVDDGPSPFSRMDPSPMPGEIEENFPGQGGPDSREP